MPTKPSRPLADRLKQATVVYTNVTADPEIAPRLAELGFGAARLARGRALLDAALDAVARQTAARAAARAATAQAREAERTLRATFQMLAQLCRAVLDNPGHLVSIAVDRPAPRRVAPLLTAAAALFHNIPEHPEIAARVAEFGFPPARLAAERGKLDALQTALQAQAAASAEAHLATRLRDEALAELERELRLLRQIARLALAAQPHLLETLGIPAWSVTPALRRESARKAAATRRARGATVHTPGTDAPREDGAQGGTGGAPQR